MVVAFLPVGGSLWIWASRDKLLDFEAHLAAKEGEMRQALREPGLRAKYGEQLRQAVQVGWGIEGAGGIDKGPRGEEMWHALREQGLRAEYGEQLRQAVQVSSGGLRGRLRLKSSHRSGAVV